MKKLFLCLSILISFNLYAEMSILILGDSLAEGYGLDESMAFPRVVEKKLIEKKKNVKVINGGVSGATSASGIQRLKWHLKKPVDVLLLELGANDGLRGLSVPDTKKNLKEIIKFAKEKKVKVMLLGILMPPNYGADYTGQFEKMYKDVAKEEKVPFLPFLLDGVAGNAKLNLPDGIHPNQKGHEVIAEKVVNFLEKNI
ncbi:MAG: arylesterase [Bacteriovoracaceae bacterium]|jgi:acyl-CoA thioesterase-1|nr:arylesterase [Bacteriovoracaceae bacterium]